MGRTSEEIIEADAKEIVSFDRMIHEPSRLAILTILWRTAGADYLFVRRLTGLSKGNLSNHLAKLEEAGLVEIGKHFEGKKPVTTVNLTKEGTATVQGYWDEMERIAAENRRRVSEGGEPAEGSAAGRLGVREAYGGTAGA